MIGQRNAYYEQGKLAFYKAGYGGRLSLTEQHALVYFMWFRYTFSSQWKRKDWKP